MNEKRFTKLPDGSVMVDNDPYIVYNDEMKEFAGEMFDEAEALGYTSKEDKARYLSGRIFEMSPFGVHQGIMEKNAIELFNGLISDDKEQHHLACINKGILQRALLESQGVKTRNNMFDIVPFTYPMKPIESDNIKQLNAIMFPLGQPLDPIHFPHFTMDAWLCKNESRQEGCRWITLDATFDDTYRFLKVRTEVDPELYAKDRTLHPKNIEEWREKYVDTNPLILTLLNLSENPLTKDVFRGVFNLWFQPLMDANEHLPRPKMEGKMTTVLR